MNNNFINNDIIHTENVFSDLTNIINEKSYSQVYLLTDNNCIEKCFPKIKDALPNDIKKNILQSGEENKSIDSLKSIWDFLIENKADRNSLLINLGGGIVTDIGGFAASTFKRGIEFVNIPTTLLAQIDASVGGKTGINYNGLKNEIGVINQAKKVLICSDFLTTLDKDEFLSGFAEMIKHALIFDKSHFEELKLFYYNDFKNNRINEISNLINKSVKIKAHFVENDVNDKGIRQTLNFGHTFGHAFESFFYKDKTKSIKHGEAVAFGMICELYLSMKKLSFPEDNLKSILKFINDVYGSLIIPEEDFETIYNYMLHDKKNISGEIKCVLLKEIGNFKIKNILNKEDIFGALKFLNYIQ